MGRGPKYKAAQPKPAPNLRCPVCGRIFKLRVVLNRHMNKAHRR